jgi:signal transduction histidine kinase/DNA-binding response OmpR family regulator
MKKFYIIFLALPILFFTLLYLSIWWFIGCVAVTMAYIAYRFYALRLQALNSRNVILEQQVDDLQERLELSVVKEQKTGKEAEQAKKSKQQLLSVLSHEIRTPMNGVMGMTMLLADSALTKEQREYTDTISSCGETLLTSVNNILVNDILDFSKLHHDGMKLEYKDFDLRDCVEEVLQMFAGKAGKAGLDLVYEIDQDVPTQLIGDNKRLRQILMNLVENAVKFTRKGEIFIGIHYCSSAVAGNPPELNFEVRDTGIGITKEQLKQLFKGIPGKEILNNGEPESSGLGLVICKKLVEMMGGQIEVKNLPQQGSTFSFRIPITPGMKPLREHAQQNNMIHLQGKHVLVVDDNPTSLTALVNQMIAWKMLSSSADSGKQALEMLSKNSGFDLVLTAVDMTDIDGVQLAKSIRNQYPAIPVIAMNYAGDETYKQEPELFASVLTKPIRQAMLRDQLLQILSVAKIERVENSTSSLSDNFSSQFPLRILIAEDNLTNQKIATRILSKLGYQPAIANNGKEVMEMISLEHYDIILMDVLMPEMSGLEATRMIRTCLEIQPIIIAMTANVMQGDRDDCIQAGMDDYMSKPIELKKLLSQLEKWSLVIRERRAIGIRD